MAPIDKGSPENIISGLVRSKGYVRLRNAMHLENRANGTVVAKAWPKKRGPSTDPAQILRNQQFAVRQYYCKDPIPEDLLMAKMTCNGTPLLFRDVLFKQQCGEMTELVLKDGTEILSWRLTMADAQQMLDSLSNSPGTILYRNSVKWVGLPRGNPGQVLTMSDGSFLPEWADNGAVVAAGNFWPSVGGASGPDNASKTYKGALFYNYRPTNIATVFAQLNPSVAETYHSEVWTVVSGKLGVKLGQSTSELIPAVANAPFLGTFTPVVTVPENTQFAIFLMVEGKGATYAWKSYYGTNFNIGAPGINYDQNASVASANAQPGDTVALNSNFYTLSWNAVP